MPITLPPRLRDEYFDFEVDLEQPAEPPTDLDVVKAMKYEKAVIEAFDMGDGEGGDGDTTPADVAAALVYKAAVIAAKNPVDAAPPWFDGMLAQINARLDAVIVTLTEANNATNTRLDALQGAHNATNMRLDVLTTRLDGIDTRLGLIDATVSQINHTVSILYNKVADNGKTTPFIEVAFPDGTLPTKPPNNLLIIASTTALNNMTDDEIQAYHLKYYPTQGHRRLNRSARIKEILRKIGRT